MCPGRCNDPGASHPGTGSKVIRDLLVEKFRVSLRAAKGGLPRASIGVERVVSKCSRNGPSCFRKFSIPPPLIFFPCERGSDAALPPTGSDFRFKSVKMPWISPYHLLPFTSFKTTDKRALIFHPVENRFYSFFCLYFHQCSSESISG